MQAVLVRSLRWRSVLQVEAIVAAAGSRTSRETYRRFSSASSLPARTAPAAAAAGASKSAAAAAAVRLKFGARRARKQVEFYLSDENLRCDNFFHEKISADSEGWLEMSLILGCKDMRALHMTREDVAAALVESKLELREGGTAVRRPGNAPLPKLEAKAAASARAQSTVARAELLQPMRPTNLQLRRLFVNSAVPFIAFGFMDQTVLIHAGDAIDATLGVRMGLPTLAAAALGQVFSDTSGVLFGGTIEAIAVKLGLPRTGLTDAQRTMGIAKRFAVLGSACGVITGCLLGMLNLLVVDTQATERAKRAEELKSLIKSVMNDGRKVLNCERATLWIADAETGELWSYVAQGLPNYIRVPISETTSIAGWVAHHKEVANISDVPADPRWQGTKSSKYRPETMLCAPVLAGDGTLIGVIQLIDKKDKSGTIIPFDVNDEKLLEMLAGHTRIFMFPDDAEAEDADVL